MSRNDHQQFWWWVLGNTCGYHTPWRKKQKLTNVLWFIHQFPKQVCSLLCNFEAKCKATLQFALKFQSKLQNSFVAWFVISKQSAKATLYFQSKLQSNFVLWLKAHRVFVVLIKLQSCLCTFPWNYKVVFALCFEIAKQTTKQLCSLCGIWKHTTKLLWKLIGVSQKFSSHAKYTHNIFKVFMEIPAKHICLLAEFQVDRMFFCDIVGIFFEQMHIDFVYLGVIWIAFWRQIKSCLNSHLRSYWNSYLIKHKDIRIWYLYIFIYLFKILWISLRLPLSVQCILPNSIVLPF